MYTNTTRITGLSGSGIDTDTMVKQLMSAESAKLYRYQRSVTWKTWQQESYRNVISKFQAFQDKWLGTADTSFRFSKAFQNFKSEIKSSKGGTSDAITVNASTSSAKYEISVSQLAQSDTYVGANPISQKIEGSADLSGIAQKLANGEEISLSFSLDKTSSTSGKSVTVTLTQSEFEDAHWTKGIDQNGSEYIDRTRDDAEALEFLLNEKLEKAFGKENVYDEDGNVTGTKAKVQASVKSDGSFAVTTHLGHSVSVSGVGTSSESSKKMQGTPNTGDWLTNGGSFTVDTGDGKTYTVVIDPSKLNDTMSAADMINSALKAAVGVDGDKDLTSMLSAKMDDDGNLVFSSKSSTSDITIKNGTGSDALAGFDNTIELKSTSDLKNYFDVNNGSTNTVKTSTTLDKIFGSDVWNNAAQTDDGKYKFTINGKDIEFSKYDTLSTFMSAVNNSGADVKLSYNATNAKFTFESAESGAVNTINFGNDSSTQSVMQALGFSYSGGAISSAQHTKTAQDAVLTVDGITTTRTSNTFDLDGMNITINKTTEPGETLTVGNEADSDATFDMIKSFVDEYNTLIGELNTSVKETRAKSDDYSYYEPLTEAEKKEMTEEEIKLWEEKAKTGLLYRDNTISSVLSKMRSIMYTSVQLEDGSKIAIHELGITTSSNYSDNGKLVIDEDKLRTAIKERGADIQSLFTGTSKSKGLADMLNDTVEMAIGTKGSLREKAGITGTASVNDNTLSKEIKELNEKISREKKRLVEKETRYYNMFSAMESSIMSSNSQLDAMFSMLGQ